MTTIDIADLVKKLQDQKKEFSHEDVDKKFLPIGKTATSILVQKENSTSESGFGEIELYEIPQGLTWSEDMGAMVQGFLDPPSKVFFLREETEENAVKQMKDLSLSCFCFEKV